MRVKRPIHYNAKEFLTKNVTETSLDEKEEATTKNNKIMK